jgi:hypothetical protein
MSRRIDPCPHALSLEAAAYAYVSSCLPIGSTRMRLPVAVKIVFIKAGANGGTPARRVRRRRSAVRRL